MSASKRRIRACCVSLILVSGVGGCWGTASSPSPSVSTVRVRVENATDSTVELRLATETSTADNEAAAEHPVFLAEEAPQVVSDGSSTEELTVRVGPHSFSEGLVGCTSTLTLAASTGTSAAIALEGDGAGTPGFDEGSLGLVGERYLIAEVHYDCGDTVVVRFEEPATVTDAVSGKVDVYAAGAAPSVQDLQTTDDDGGGSADEPAGEGEEADDGTVQQGDDPGDTPLSLTLENQTGSAIQFELTTGTDSGEDVQTDVTVVPLGSADGTVACSERLTIRALILESESGLDGSEPTQYQVVLTGDGTGTEGFDEDTIGPGNGRILLRDEHYSCGDRVRAVILYDASDVDEEEDGVPRVGLGGIEVVAEDG